jgi:large subunit ribosomal protein L3
MDEFEFFRDITNGRIISMPVGILGKKMGMTQVFDQDGNCIPVTVIQAGPCYVTGIKTRERDRYAAIQLGYDEVPEKKLNLPRKGHLKKAEVKPLKVLREFRVPEEATAELALGQEVVVSQFKPGDFVDVTGTSKGKGFTGVIKRHNYHGSKASHGVHEYFRHGGSIGGCTPAHTVKGTKMPGRSGAARVTLQNVEVVQVRDQEHLLMIKGGLPGARNSLVMIRKAIKK